MTPVYSQNHKCITFNIIHNVSYISTRIVIVTNIFYYQTHSQDASNCFIVDFKAWAEQNGVGFPIHRGGDRSFAEYLHSFWNDAGQPTDKYGFDDYSSPSRVTYAVFSFYTNMPRYGSGFLRAPHFTAWEMAIDSLNNRAPPTAKGAMQSSEIWSGVFTEVIAVSGTLYSIVVVILVAFWAIAILTTNLLAAMAAITTIMLALIFILASFHWIGWTLGIVEAIGISILLGAAVDYPLHFVESYIETSPEVEREAARTGFCSRESIHFRRRVITRALSKIGPSILNSAFTTSGSVFFLFACKIKIFVKVGTIILLSALVSIFLSIFFLPPILLLCGPNKIQRSWKRVGILAASVGTLFGVCLLVLYLLSLAGVQLNGPSGTPLFYDRLLQNCVDPMN